MDQTLTTLFSKTTQAARAGDVLYIRFPDAINGSIVQTLEDLEPVLKSGLQKDNILRAFVKREGEITIDIDLQIEKIQSNDPSIQRAIDRMYATLDQLKDQGENTQLNQLEWTPV